MKKILAVLLFIAVSCTEEQRKDISIQEDSVTAQPIDTVLTNRVSSLEKHAAMQDSVIKVLALHAYHADSVAEKKQIKSDRAERRGRFLGGLLKTLIPGL